MNGTLGFLRLPCQLVVFVPGSAVVGTGCTGAGGGIGVSKYRLIFSVVAVAVLL